MAAVAVLIGPIPYGIAPIPRQIIARHLWMWNDPQLRQVELAKMRATNAEWDFMGRSFLAVLVVPVQAVAIHAILDRWARRGSNYADGEPGESTGERICQPSARTMSR